MTYVGMLFHEFTILNRFHKTLDKNIGKRHRYFGAIVNEILGTYLPYILLATVILFSVNFFVSFSSFQNHFQCFNDSIRKI